MTLPWNASHLDSTGTGEGGFRDADKAIVTSPKGAKDAWHGSRDHIEEGALVEQ